MFVQYPGMEPKHIVRLSNGPHEASLPAPANTSEFGMPKDTMLQSEFGGFLVPGKRRRINIVAICVNVFGPWLLFCGIFACQSLALHYEHPYGVWLVSLFGILCSMLLFSFAARERVLNREPYWYNFAAIACCFGTVCATAFGSANFWINTMPYFDIEGLSTVTNVNPARVLGQQMMDVGIVNWADGSGVDTRMSMGFKSDDTYCVAPIVNDGEPMRLYDFWAVGINCCGDGEDFRCGEWNSPHARSGLRQMRAGERPFFRLAVQQAEAAFHIQAPHPVFFYWMADPASEVNQWRDDVLKYYFQGVILYFVFNALSVAFALIGFSKIGQLSRAGFKR